MAAKLLIADGNPAARSALEAAFSQAGYQLVTASTGLEAVDRVVSESPDLVFLDSTLPQLNGIEVCYRLRQNPLTKQQILVVLGARGGLEELQAAFQAGADDYLTKPVDAREAVISAGAMISRAQRLKAAAPHKSTLISFFSARGGVGTTSVCVNTASALARMEAGKEPGKDAGKIVVADMVLPFGSVSYSTNVPGKVTLAQLCGQETKQFSKDDMDELLLTREGLGFSVMIGASSPAESRQISPKHMESLLKALKEASRFALVDVGRNMSAISIPVIEASDRVVMVLSPDLVTLRMARTSLDFLDTLQISRRRLVLVLSLPVGREGMSRTEAEDHLQVPIFGVIPYEGDKFTVAANQGIPLVQKEPTCTASQQFMELARYLVSTEK